MTVCPGQKLVNRYIAGNCTPDERKEVETHLAECETCRHKVESARASRANQDEFVTKSMPGVPDFPSDTHISDKSWGSAFENYQILEELPRGGQAVVYKAIHTPTKTNVAIKVLLPSLLASARARYYFEREAELIASLDHPNIVKIRDSGIIHGQYYFVMEYIKGQPLNRYVHLQNLSFRERVVLFNKICTAITYAHQQGIIHRDLKFANILIDKRGEPHILDFGLAKAIGLSEKAGKSATVTVTGQWAGSLSNMSPEQAAGKPCLIDMRTDVYSLGIILYHMLTGKYPYDVTGSTLEVLQNIQKAEPVRPRQIIRKFDSDIEAILLSALAKDRAQRYQSTADLQSDIDNWLQGRPIRVRSISTVYLLRKIIVRHQTVSIVASLLLVIIVSTVFISLYSYSQAQAALKQSQLKQEWYMKEAKRISTFSNQVAFASFLSEWHNNEAFTNLRAFFFKSDKKSREHLAALFLLDPRPLAEKQAQFREKLFADGDQSSFLAFVIGEYHLKNKNEAAAMEAYKQCLEAGQDSSELDDWFQNRAKRKLNKLLNENIPLRTCPNINAR